MRNNFKIITNIERADCQIVGLQKIKGGKFKVKVRTLNNEIYEVKATDKGKIETLEPKMYK